MGARLKGKVVIVTGAGSTGSGIGNGKASSILYAREGAKVILVDRNYDAALETKKMIDIEGGDSFAIQADVTKADDCKRIVITCMEKYGRIDVLHNNVGITKAGGVVEFSEEDWDRIMAVNLKGMFLTCKYALPYMKEQKSGVITNISSINAIRTPPIIATAYSASKAGVIALTRDIAVQYAADGIRANTIVPGYMDTPMVIEQLKDSYEGTIEEMKKKRASMCPMKRQGEPWDVAKAAVFLASDEAAYITGICLVVDGGVFVA
jgi:NAD(P)-dependent dehydrogenase (short-subunit alcohol dehydrogenase family)